MDEDDYAISHQTPPELTEKCKMVQEMVGGSYVHAWKALVKHKQDVVAAIDELMSKPAVTGDKYIPAKPVVASTLDPEQEERCKRGRWLQDQVSGVYSVAHSQTKTLPDQQAPEVAEVQTTQVSVPLAPES
jgi:hypothetical protein